MTTTVATRGKYKGGRKQSKESEWTSVLVACILGVHVPKLLTLSGGSISVSRTTEELALITFHPKRACQRIN
jgi:hypothetical protein